MAEITFSIAYLSAMGRNCTAQMNRAVEILGILRKGMESMLGDRDSIRVNYLRIFNFDQKRVSLRMEVSENGCQRFNGADRRLRDTYQQWQNDLLHPRELTGPARKSSFAEGFRPTGTGV